ncbi:MAG: thermonuclease family protein [Sneathiella sp.]
MRLILILLLSIHVGSAWAGNKVQRNQYWANVTHVVDGDTFDVEVENWPDHVVKARIRLLKVDTPEKRAACERERIMSKKAEARTRQLIGEKLVRLVVFGRDSFNRVLAVAYTEGGLNIGKTLLDEEIAYPYKKGMTENPWCSES